MFHGNLIILIIIRVMLFSDSATFILLCNNVEYYIHKQ